MENLLNLFSDKLTAENGASPATAESYLRDIEQFLNHEKILPEEISSENITDFIRSLNQRHYALKTLNRKISAIRGFCKFLIEEKKLKSNPLPDITMPKREKPLPKFLDERQISELYQKALSHNKPAFKRIGIIILLMFASGLRVSEAVSLKANAVNHNKMQITVKGKGSKERIVFINPETNTALLSYINETRNSFIKKNQTSPFLFPSLRAKQGHLTRDAFFKDLKLLAVECGISPCLVFPHVLRHSFATNLINHDADLRSVQKMLGHAHIETTEIYTHITSSKIIDSVFQKHPLQKMSNP